MAALLQSALLLAMFLVTSWAQLPLDSIASLIDYRFKDIDGSYLYFCQEKDAVVVFKQLSQITTRRYNIRHLMESTETPKEVFISYWQPSRLGIFVDLSCETGLEFLHQCTNLFNASYAWLLWTEDAELQLEGLFDGSRLSADSDVLLARPSLTLTDIYKVHTTAQLIQTDIGEWVNSTYVQITDRPDRRQFQGFIFNASLMMIDIEFNESNLIEPLLDNGYESGKDMVRRYGLSVFIHLAEFYNFSYSYVLTHAWGDPLPNGTWTGMVGQVARGEAEFGLAPAKFIVHRYNIIDFITSLHIVKVCFTFLQPKLFGSAKALVLPLDDTVWICLAGTALLTVIAFRILSRYDDTGVGNDSWAGSALLVIGAISQQGIPDNTEKTPTRIVYVFLLFVSFFVSVYYNTSILNGLLLPAPNAIQNFEELLASDTKLGLFDMPYIHNEMQQNDSLTVRVREKLLKSKVPKYYLSAAEGVANMKKGHFAFYTEDESIYAEILRQMTDAQVCSVSEVTKYNPFHVGVVSKKDSPYKELFNRVFALMRERGVMHRQLTYWTLKKPECHWRQDAISIGVEPLRLAYVVTILGVVGSLIVLAMERLTANRQGHLITRQQKL